MQPRTSELKAFFDWYVGFNEANARILMNNIRHEFRAGKPGLQLTPDNLEKIRQAVQSGYLPDLSTPAIQKVDVSRGAINAGDSEAQ